jgi:hypothetical protein
MSQQRQFKGLLSSPPEPSPTWSPPFQPPYTPLPNIQQQWFMQPGQTSHCNRCGKELGFIDRIGLDKQIPRCRTCSNQIHQSLQRFRKTFLDVTRSGVFSTNEWAALRQVATQERLDKSEALTFIMRDSIALVERVVAQVEANGEVTNEVELHVSQMLSALCLPQEIALPLLERVKKLKRRTNVRLLDRAVAELEGKGDCTDADERHIHRLQAALAILPEEAQPYYQRLASLKQHANIQAFQRAAALVEAKGEVTEETQHSILQLQQSLAIPNEIALPIFQRLAYLKKLTSIRHGNLPSILTNVQLESDEICHLEISAIYYKVNTKSTTYLEGRLVATNKRLHFLSTTRGMTINWSNIMRVEVRHSSVPSRGGVYLELSRGTGNGLYAVTDPTLVQAVLDTLVKIAKRQLVVTNTEPSRHIPQDVKNTVWQRDGGKCTQCSSTSYLEYDHIIPHTKGGANTVANVQLLCRSCNLKKSDRI